MHAGVHVRAGRAGIARRRRGNIAATAWKHCRGNSSAPRGVIRAVLRWPMRRTRKVNFGAALAKTIFLARRLKKIWQRMQKMVGLLLPPSVPGALVNYAALLCGKVPVNLNYTLSAETLASCAKQCEIKTVLTSRAFLEKVKLTVPGEVIYLEDVAAKSRRAGKIHRISHGEIFPSRIAGSVRWLQIENRKSTNQKSLDDLATVIFSSGSTGEPKGVMLSHYNIVSNVEQIGADLWTSHIATGCSACCRFFIRSVSPARFACRRAAAWAWCFIPIRSMPKPSARSCAKMRSRFCSRRRLFCNCICAAVAPGDFGSLRTRHDRRGKIARTAGHRVRGTILASVRWKVMAAPNVRPPWP